MEYRINNYYVERDGEMLDIFFTKPDDIALTTVSGGTMLDTTSRRRVIEAIRLIADETVGGCILCSTGAKSNIATVRQDTQMGYDFIVRFNLSAMSEAATVEGDTDEATSIESIQQGDCFTIKMDWGDTLYDTIQPIANEYTNGKAAIVAACNNKFGETLTANTTLDNIADVINQLGNGINLNEYINNLE